MWPRRVLAGFLLLCSVALYCRNVPLTDLGSARAPGDFKVYLTARDRVAAGEDPYRLDVYSEYKYSPAMVLPYSVLPRSHDAAWLINKAILVLTWAVSIWAGVLGIGAFTWRHLDLSLWGEFRLLFRGDELDLSFWEDFREGGLDLPFWLDFRLSLREGDLGLLWNFRLPFRGFIG